MPSLIFLKTTVYSLFPKELYRSLLMAFIIFIPILSYPNLRTLLKKVWIYLIILFDYFNKLWNNTDALHVERIGKNISFL